METIKCSDCQRSFPVDHFQWKVPQSKGRLSYCKECGGYKVGSRQMIRVAHPLVREEVIWAAGLFEGEGCIFASNYREGYCLPGLCLQSTDEDVVRRFDLATRGLGKVSGPRVFSNPKWRPTWQWTAYGVERTQAILVFFWPWLGERRKAKTIEVLAECRLNPKINRNRRICTVDGCGTPSAAKGLCKIHYGRRQTELKQLARNAREAPPADD